MYTGWQEYFDNLHNWLNPNWGSNPMGLIIENLNPGKSDEYLTQPEGEAEAETSGAEADTEEAARGRDQGILRRPMAQSGPGSRGSIHSGIQGLRKPKRSPVRTCEQYHTPARVVKLKRQ